jgi:hypothetical protein
MMMTKEIMGQCPWAKKEANVLITLFVENL